jgi:hypothetical protein
MSVAHCVFQPAWPRPLAHWLHRSTAVAGATRIEMGRKDPTTAASGTDVVTQARRVDVPGFQGWFMLREVTRQACKALFSDQAGRLGWCVISYR